ncbi:MAG: hypothetical protein AAB459_00685 [Patescibacteria group bacterium]
MAKEFAKRRRGYGKYILLGVNVFIIVGLTIFGTVYYRRYQHLKNNPPSATDLAQAEIDRYIAEVGKLYDLPKDEKPQVATVKDKEKLKDQPFFIKAENDDITLIYTGAKLAILYRPSTKQIVNVSTVTVQEPAKIKILGPEASRALVEKTLTESFKNEASVSEKADAKGSYTGVIVVDLSGQKSDLAQKLATSLKGRVETSLPSNEDKPNGIDIVIIASAPAATTTETPTP